MTIWVAATTPIALPQGKGMVKRLLRGHSALTEEESLAYQLRRSEGNNRGKGGGWWGLPFVL